jgi:hypothetical protein
MGALVFGYFLLQAPASKCAPFFNRFGFHAHQQRTATLAILLHHNYDNLSKTSGFLPSCPLDNPEHA